jgi:hypothetical protein
MHKNGKISEEIVVEARVVREANIVTQAHDFHPDNFAKRFQARLAA